MRITYFLFSSLIAAACTGDDGGSSNGGSNGSAQGKVGAQCWQAHSDCKVHIASIVDKGTAQIQICINAITTACKDGVDDGCIKAHADCNHGTAALEPELAAAHIACNADVAAACPAAGTLEGPIGPECQVVIETCVKGAEAIASRGFARCVLPAIEACLDSADVNACVQAEVRCLQTAADLLTSGSKWLFQCHADFAAACL